MARGRPAPYPRRVCFNLTFESEEELAAIAEGVAVDRDRDADAPDGSLGGPVSVPAR